MSLNFQLGKIKDYKKVCFKDNGKMWSMTEAIIWGCLYTDIGSITAKNAAEYFHRINYVQADAGGLVFDYSGGKPEPVWITLKDVEAHIGLTTNCTTRTRKQWEKKQSELKRREALRSAQTGEPNPV